MAKTKGRTAQDKPDTNESPKKNKALIVGIGASAGGIKPLQILFETLPGDLGLAYVVILHLAPEVHSELDKILAVRTPMPVMQVEGPTALEPDHVYVISPDRALSISDHQIVSIPFDEPR
jgi:two-component system CheB/CheR fusion protein